jgi:hypothetical protein
VKAITTHIFRAVVSTMIANSFMRQNLDQIKVREKFFIQLVIFAEFIQAKGNEKAIALERDRMR